MKRSFGKLALAALAVASLSSAVVSAYEVGDTVPYVIVEGVDANNQTTAGPLISTDKATQSFTLLEFFSVTDAVSRANLATITAESQDLIADVTTKLIAVDADTDHVKEYRADYAEDFKFMLALDPQQATMRAFQVKKVPTIFLVNDDYKIIFKSEGALTVDVVNALRKTINYDAHSTTPGVIKVGDLAPSVVLSQMVPGGMLVNKDLRLPETTAQAYTVLALSSIYSQDGAKNLVAYRDLNARHGARAAVRYVANDADSAAVMRYVQQYPAFFQYPVALDTKKASLKAFGTQTLPTTYVLDKTGKVLLVKAGLLNPADVAAIEAILVK